jgi:hypothetical protein
MRKPWPNGGCCAQKNPKFVCCQVVVPATSWSLFQKSPTDCGASRNLVNEKAVPHWGFWRRIQHSGTRQFVSWKNIDILIFFLALLSPYKPMPAWYFNLYEPCVLYKGRAHRYLQHTPFFIFFKTNKRTEFFKHAAHSPFLSLQNAVYFIMLPFLVTVLITFYPQGVLKKLKISGAKRLKYTRSLPSRLIPNP